MNSNLFRRYVWLVDTVDHAGKITFEEISNLWDNSPLNVDHDILALRTFHNHRDAIEALFGIKIICHRRNGNVYSIEPTGPLGRDTKLRIWMLQTLSNSYYMHLAEDDAVADRVLADINPEEQYGLIAIIEAMNAGMCLHVVNSIPMTEEHATEFIVEPYCVRFWGSSWYLLAKDHKTGKFISFDLARIINLENMGINFKYDTSFNPDKFFENYYGMDINPNIKPIEIRVRIGDGTRDLLRTKPIHVSQKEVQADRESSIFQFHLAPGIEFKKKILTMGDDAEILTPTELRDEMGQMAIRLARRYTRW